MPEDHSPTGDMCQCPRIALGLEITEARNWSPRCPVHGLESAWWDRPEQRERRAKQAERSIALQLAAAEARRQARRQGR